MLWAAPSMANQLRGGAVDRFTHPPITAPERPGCGGWVLLSTREGEFPHVLGGVMISMAAHAESLGLTQQ